MRANYACCVCSDLLIFSLFHTLFSNENTTYYFWVTTCPQGASKKRRMWCCTVCLHPVGLHLWFRLTEEETAGQARQNKTCSGNIVYKDFNSHPQVWGSKKVHKKVRLCLIKQKAVTIPELLNYKIHGMQNVFNMFSNLWNHIKAWFKKKV